MNAALPTQSTFPFPMLVLPCRHCVQLYAVVVTLTVPLGQNLHSLLNVYFPICAELLPNPHTLLLNIERRSVYHMNFAKGSLVSC